MRPLARSALLGFSLLIAARSFAASAPEGPYRFILGKLLALEGSAEEAARSYEEAAKAAPEDSYLRLEIARLALRRAQFSDNALGREKLLREAQAQAEAAIRLDAANADALRLLGQIRLAQADEDPAALGKARETFEALHQNQSSDPQSLITLGQIYLAQGDNERAAGALREAHRLAPANHAATSLLLETLLKLGKAGEAEELLRSALAGDAESVDLRLRLAEMEAQRGDHQAAVATLGGAPASAARRPELRRRLSFELFRAGEPEAALPEIDAVLRETPGDSGAHYLRALCLAAGARNGEASAELAPLHEKNPDNVDIARTLARVLERDGKRTQARALLEDTLAHLGPETKVEESGPLRIELGSAYLRDQDWLAAQKVLQPLASGEPSDWRSEALLLSADALLGAGRGPEALALLAPEAAAPAFQAKRGELLKKVGDTAQSEQVLQRLAQSGKAEEELQAGEAYQRLEDYASAIAPLERALAHQPDSTRIAFHLAAVYERAGRRADAIVQFRALLKRAPDFAPALNYLGYMFAERNENLSEALELIRHAVAIDPDNGAYVDSLGWAHFRMGNYKPAREFLERASGLTPDDQTVLEHLGDVYAATGDVERARETYRQALRLVGPNSQQLERKLQGLRGGGS